MFVQGKSRTIFFPSNTLIYGISRDGSKNFNIHTCEHMILGQLRMGAHQAKNAPLITMALTTHWFLSGLLSCLACCFSVDHRRGGGLKMQVGEITLLPLLDYLPTIGLSYSLIDIIKMIYCSTDANMSDNYFVTQQWRWAFSSRNRKCKFITI